MQSLTKTRVVVNFDYGKHLMVNGKSVKMPRDVQKVFEGFVEDKLNSMLCGDLELDDADVENLVEWMLPYWPEIYDLLPEDDN